MRPCAVMLVRRALFSFTSSLPVRHPLTHRTGTVSLATPAIGGFGPSLIAYRLFDR